MYLIFLVWQPCRQLFKRTRANKDLSVLFKIRKNPNQTKPPHHYYTAFFKVSCFQELYIYAHTKMYICILFPLNTLHHTYIREQKGNHHTHKGNKITFYRDECQTEHLYVLIYMCVCVFKRNRSTFYRGE